MISDLSRLLSVFEAYVEATGLSPKTVSTRFMGRGGRIDQIRAGGDMGSLTIAKALTAFSAAWPPDAAWPVDVPRPPVGAPSDSSATFGAGTTLTHPAITDETGEPVVMRIGRVAVQSDDVVTAVKGWLTGGKA
jgi:hypothetical protein